MNTVPALFESIVARRGNEPALVDVEGTLGYAELNTRVNRLARRLIAHGVGLDSLVAIAMPKSRELIVAIMAVLKAGGAYLPLDPGYPAERLSFMLSDARPVLLLRSSSVAPLGAGPEELVPEQDHTVFHVPDQESLVVVMYQARGAALAHWRDHVCHDLEQSASLAYPAAYHQ